MTQNRKHTESNSGKKKKAKKKKKNALRKGRNSSMYKNDLYPCQSTLRRHVSTGTRSNSKFPRFTSSFSVLRQSPKFAAVCCKCLGPGTSSMENLAQIHVQVYHACAYLDILFFLYLRAWTQALGPATIRGSCVRGTKRNGSRNCSLLYN